MAVFTMVDDSGLKSAVGLGLTNKNIGELVEQAASKVPWNSLGSPVDFGEQEYELKPGVTMFKNVHEPSGVEFKSGFLMKESVGQQQKWESKANSGEFRLDLQNIENGYANFSIQTNGKNSKTIAKCMMQVNKSFGQGQLYRALVMSRDQKKTCYLKFQ